MPFKRGKTTFYKPSYSTATATGHIKKIFKSEKVFDTSKAVDLIKDLLRLGNARNDSIVLDFFAGSGTTAEAVMQLNNEDGGKRKFILVQEDAPIDKKEHPIPYEYCKKNKLDPVISSICLERVRKVASGIKKSGGDLANMIDLGYKVFSLVEGPKISGRNTLGLQNNRETVYDTLYNMMMHREAMLHSEITEVEKDKLYLIDGAYYVVGRCERDLSEVKEPIYVDGYINNNLEECLNLVGLGEQNPNVQIIL